MNIFKNFFSKYDKDGYDKNGYDKDGFDRNGWNNKRINKITKTKYDKNGFDKIGWDINGINRETGTKYNKKGYDKNGFDIDGYNIETGTIYARNGFDRNGINKYTKTEYDERGYDKDGYNRNGFDRRGFDRNGINKYTKTEYDERGYDKHYNRDRNRKYKKTINEKLEDLIGFFFIIIIFSHLIYGIIKYSFLEVIASFFGVAFCIIPMIFALLYFVIRVIEFIQNKINGFFSSKTKSVENNKSIEIPNFVIIILVGLLGVFVSRMTVSLAKSSSNSIPDWAEPNIEEPIPDYSDIYDEYYNEYCRIKGNVNFDNGEKIYHLPGCPYYEETVINPDYGERWFCTEKEAIDAGWRKSYDCY